MVKQTLKGNKIKVKVLSDDMVIQGFRNMIAEKDIIMGGLEDEKDALNSIIVSQETKIKILKQKLKVDMWFLGFAALVIGILSGILIFN